jgi:hypothetical protein
VPPGCFALTDEDWELVAAHFRRRHILPVEEELIRVLDDPKSKQDVYWAVIALRQVGSLRCIPALKAKLHYPMQDVKDCVLLTIAHLAGEAETPFYVHALEDKRTRKSYPMWAIEVAGDERAVDPVARYVTGVLKKSPPPSAGFAGETYIKALQFLAQFRSERPELEAVFELAREVLPRLPDAHRKQLAALLSPS